MKHTIKHFLVAALVLLSYQSQANSWRVCSRPEARAYFTSVSAAVASLEVFAGDTLYIEPGHVESSGVTINKRLTLIGPGYYMNRNNINAMDPGEAKFVSSITLTKDSIIIYGCLFTDILNIRGDYITIERCLFSNTSLNINSYSSINNYTRKNLYIRNNFFNRSSINRSNYTSSTREDCVSSIFENNIFLFGLFACVSNDEYNACTFRNNTIVYNGANNNKLIQRAINCQIYNNILIHNNSGYTTSVNNETQTVDTLWYRNDVLDAPSSSGNDVHHNILSCSPNSDYPNCIFNITDPEMVLLWSDTLSIEERFKHITNGIAVGAGTGGTTVGAYGTVTGSTPYRQGGIPLFRPYIYDATIDQTPSSNNTINASFKIKLQNE